MFYSGYARGSRCGRGVRGTRRHGGRGRVGRGPRRGRPGSGGRRIELDVGQGNESM